MQLESGVLFSTLLTGAIVLVGLFPRSQGLVCWHCNSASHDECMKTGENLFCQIRLGEECKNISEVNVQSIKATCSTVIRKKSSQVQQVIKQCKQIEACLSDQDQNWGRVNGGRQCYRNGPTSVCRCCCYEDNCNSRDTCNPYRRQLCRKIPKSFAHGEPPRTICTNSNRAGSTCRFSCTGDKVVIPSHSETITCLSDGKWSKPIPSCAVPCPRSMFVDFVSMVHRKREEDAIRLIQTLVREFLEELTDIGPTSLRLGRLHYGSHVHTPHLFFKDTINATNEEVFNFLENEAHFDDSDTGEVNTGAALWYAHRNLFGAEGDRPDAKNILLLSTDENADDDVIAPSRALHEAGVRIYPFYARDENGGKPMDRTQFTAMAGYSNTDFLAISDGHESQCLDSIKVLV